MSRHRAPQGGTRISMPIIADAWQIGLCDLPNRVSVGPVCTLEQAIADGMLVEIFKHRWPELSGGKPIVATAHLFNEVSLAGLLEMWNEFADWRENIIPNFRFNITKPDLYCPATRRFRRVPALKMAFGRVIPHG
jgi:hypothetical protein